MKRRIDLVQGWELRQAGCDVPLDALSDEECAQALFQLLQPV